MPQRGSLNRRPLAAVSLAVFAPLAFVDCAASDLGKKDAGTADVAPMSSDARQDLEARSDSAGDGARSDVTIRPPFQCIVDWPPAPGNVASSQTSASPGLLWAKTIP